MSSFSEKGILSVSGFGKTVGKKCSLDFSFHANYSNGKLRQGMMFRRDPLRYGSMLHGKDVS